MSNTSDLKSSVLSSSGFGVLFKIIEEHLDLFKEQDANVIAFIQHSGQYFNTLKQAKQEAVDEEVRLLVTLLDIHALDQFLNNTILIENLFNNLYKPLKQGQEDARKKYAPNIDNYKDLPKPVSKINSFVEMMFGDEMNVRQKALQKWIDEIKDELKKNNINYISCTDVNVKNTPRAFYKAYYLYKGKFEELTDTLRCSFVFNSFDDVYQAFSTIEKFSSSCGGILRVKDRYNPIAMPFGYRDILINVYCPNSKVVVELQLHHDIFFRNKKISHAIYKYARLFEGDRGNSAYEYAKQFIRPRLGNDIVYQDKELSSSHHDVNANKEGDWKNVLRRWRLHDYIDWTELTQNVLKDAELNDEQIKKFIESYGEELKETEDKNKPSIVGTWSGKAATTNDYDKNYTPSTNCNLGINGEGKITGLIVWGGGSVHSTYIGETCTLNGTIDQDNKFQGVTTYSNGPHEDWSGVFDVKRNKLILKSGRYIWYGWNNRKSSGTLTLELTRVVNNEI